jgi:hypothetical protein
MDLLRSSILGKEFVNYRKHTTENERRRFYKTATGYNKIPVVIDSVEEEFINIFRKKSYINGMRVISYGLELEMDVSSNINDVIKEIKIELVKANKEHLFAENEIKLGLENGTIITDEKELVYNLYKKFRNVNDNILYLLVTQEKSMYNYIMSIFRSLFGIFYKKQ